MSDYDPHTEYHQEKHYYDEAAMSERKNTAQSDVTEPTQASKDAEVLSRLPYTLTEGVTATRAGLRIDEDHEALVVHFMNAKTQSRILHYETPSYATEWLIQWPDAAERLRYREGKPCSWITQNRGPIYSGLSMVIPHPGNRKVLHRLAAILCDDADAFRVLYECIETLGGE